jgi:nucleotide-binding universal stress UspA family protein
VAQGFKQWTSANLEHPMTYRSLLLFLDDHPLCTTRTRVAIQLAKRLDCHLVGLAPTGLIEMPGTAGAAASLASFAALAWDTLRERAERAAQDFSKACSAAGLPSYETVIDEAEQAASLVRHGHCSDLILLTQADPAATDHRRAQERVEQVVLYSARPTLVLPYAGRFDTLASSALVAWDDSREAARAVSDALPLLRQAERVQVIIWNENGTAGEAAQGRARLDALQTWLMWQGVTADVGIETTALPVAEAMLSRAADLSADLLVMGAYGHARWSERILGGATRGLLASMTLPVAMSH